MRVAGAMRKELCGSSISLPKGSNLTHTPSAGRIRSLFALERRYAIGLACFLSFLALLGLAGRASALNYVYDTNHDDWAVNDAAIPGLDTGSIQSHRDPSLQGYGGIRMQVDGAPKTPLLNGVMLRGFGDTYDGSNSFSSHHAVSLGGVAVTRSADHQPGKKLRPLLRHLHQRIALAAHRRQSTSAVSSGTT